MKTQNHVRLHVSLSMDRKKTCIYGLDVSQNFFSKGILPIKLVLCCMIYTQLLVLIFFFFFFFLYSHPINTGNKLEKQCYNVLDQQLYKYQQTENEANAVTYFAI